MHEVLCWALAFIGAFASLMELMDAEAKVDGVSIHILAGELQRIGKVLSKMQNAYGTVELMEA